MRPVLLVCALAACSMDARGVVTVQTPPSKSPFDEAFVLFRDPDGATRRAHVDSAGRASGELTAGGDVAFVLAADKYRSVQMYTDVALDAVVEFGVQPPTRAPLTRTLFVDGSPPAGTTALFYGSVCGSGAVRESTIQLTDRCGAMTDLVVIACDNTGLCQNGVYQVRTGVAVMSNTSVWLDPSAWRPLDLVTMDLLNSSRLSFAHLAMTGGWGLQGERRPSDVSQIIAAAPPFGLLGLSGQVGIPGAVPQTIEAYLGSGERAVDLHSILAPWVIRGPRTWTTDDDGGALVADAKVTNFTWRSNQLVIFSAPSTEGNYKPPRLPRDLGPLFPDDSELETSVRLIRFAERFEDPQRTANFVLSGGDFRSSYAITSFQ